jgi:S1-C subfamily serine protease
MRDGKPVRLEGVEAKVAHVYPKLDLAILQPVKPIETLKPLPMASAGPRPGAKVFVVGNPAMGQQVLDLSITDGIVSNARRVIDGKEYVQHTAAVNPGSFGGPLIDESGQIVGLVTRGADLEGVGFAMPVSVIRPMFETGK